MVVLSAAPRKQKAGTSTTSIQQARNQQRAASWEKNVHHASSLPVNPTDVPPDSDWRGGAGHKMPNGTRSDCQHQQQLPGRFVPGRILGAGTFSIVKLATHTASNRKVAMKLLSHEKVAHLGTSERVSREIHHLRLCAAHPHVTRLYDVVETPSDTALILEYVSGGDLYDYVKRYKRGLPSHEARLYFQQLVSAVEYMHHKCVAHRDLKLENVLFDAPHRSVKIADFGLSNTIREGEYMQTPCGSPHYAAPEVISGTPYQGAPADLWSVGVILFGMVAGQLPFHETNMKEQFKKIKSGTYSVPRHVSSSSSSSRGAVELIRGLLTVSVADRMSIRDVRANPWFRHDMPPYLSQTPEEMEASERKVVDEDVVHQVVVLFQTSQLPHGSSGVAVTRQLVERAVASESGGGGGGGSNGGDDDDEALLLRDLRCTYELILDDRHAQRHMSQIPIATTPAAAAAASASSSAAAVAETTPLRNGPRRGNFFTRRARRK